MSIAAKPFGSLPDGQAVTQYTMTNAVGGAVSVIDYGAIFTAIVVPDAAGVPGDVALGFDSLEKYLAGHGSMGDTVGRYGNRIALGRFELDGKTYQLSVNDGVNHLHGGFTGFSRKMWQVQPQEGKGEDKLVLTLTSPDGEEGYPGTVNVTLTVTWDDTCRLTLHYEADTDKPTLLNMTNHTYFNLGGSATIHDHVLSVESDKVTLVADSALIPTGELGEVNGPLDLRGGKRLGDCLDAMSESETMMLAGGFDVNYALRKGEGMGLAATLSCPATGRAMDVLTDQPGIQVYSACTTDLAGGRGGAHYGRYCGVCLETQHFPDSPNNPQFPGTTVLRPGEHYDTTTVYAFRVEK